MTISEAHKVWTKIVKGSQVSQEEILEARKTYEETIEEWHKRDDINRETIGDQEGYDVIASMGHVRDLPKARLSVDIKNDFAPKYDIIKGKEKLVKEQTLTKQIRQKK